MSSRLCKHKLLSQLIKHPNYNIKCYSLGLSSFRSPPQAHKLTLVVCTSPVEKANFGCQTLYDKAELGSKVENTILRNELAISRATVPTIQSQQGTFLEIDDIKHDDKQLKFFTGLLYLHFMALFIFLGPVVNKLTYWNRPTKSKRKTSSQTKPIDELFMTLVTLRRGYCFVTMSVMFHLTETTLRWSARRC